MSEDRSASPGPTKDGASGYVRALIEKGAAYAPGDAGWGETAAGVPAKPGVVALEDEGGRTVLLGTTADARRFVTARCVRGDSGQWTVDSGHRKEGGKRADIGAVTARAVVVPVGSGFEADLLYLAMARERTPGAYAKLMARWGVWVVRLDAGDEFPEPRAMRFEEAAGAPAHTMLGPVSEQGAARLMDVVVDAFDLCRYPNILRQAPRGTACAYKEMGRCPAPCDGSEGMESYRERVRDAVRAVGSSVEERERALTVRIKEAAAGARFEEAGALKKALERIKALDAPALRGATTMDRFRHCVVAGGSTRSAARIFAFAGGRLIDAIEVRGAERGEISRVARLLAEQPVRLAGALDEIEALSTLVRWSAKPDGNPAKRRVRVVRVAAEGDIGGVEAAVRWVLRTNATGADAEVDEIEHGD